MIRNSDITEYSVRINGSAPAWPHLLGQHHPFYYPFESQQLGSASYSLLRHLKGAPEVVEYEILIDAGHNTVPFLLQNGNRIPDDLVLTHGHPDHVLGVDWIAQSKRFSKGNPDKLRIHATQPVWDQLMRSWRHIEAITEHIPLRYGETYCFGTEKEIRMTVFPVYHGQGAKGASMLLFEFPERKAAPVLFTGDMLCPLIRDKDYDLLAQAGMLFIDTNNRFPYPESNHISFTSCMPDSSNISPRLRDWLTDKEKEKQIQLFTKAGEKADKKYWEEWGSDYRGLQGIPHSIIDFVKRCPVPKVCMVHYFGLYDRQLYEQELLTPGKLELWANDTARTEGVEYTTFRVPNVGGIITL